ncbi:hypothetical protein NDU88_005412 [Pleurodeles waltl]|uniref:PH domain-containing protein n=2 Tax=Pleurodeles waltl TaxID=8319 RepID=A0AAV7QFV1_PLEWA|nr:hypothetical protein NDU88_005412 [Pleurodeles waltl]
MCCFPRVVSTPACSSTAARFLPPDLSCRSTLEAVSDAAAMDLRSELLKSIWYAFTALDVEKSGKVSKSQLKVLSHNLYTVLCIPHDPVALEEHFRDDDDGPVSSQGYMPYLNKYILDKVIEGTFVKENFDELCWTLSAKKNYKTDQNGHKVLSQQDAFRLWCIFNFLSEDKYPLVMVPDEVAYLMKKVYMAMNLELNCSDLDECLSQDSLQQSGLTVWKFLELVNSGGFLKGIEQEIISMAIEEVYQEIIQDVLKQGYLWKRGTLRRNWTERWFTLKSTSLCYYLSEERKDKKGFIPLDKNCCLEVLPDRDGKRCMFCVKTPSRTYEMSAMDTRQRQEWMTAIQTAIRLQEEGKRSYHKDLKQKRREQRELKEQQRAVKEEERLRLKQLQEEREYQQQEIERLKEAQQQNEMLMQEEEKRRQLQHEEMQRALEVQLQEAEQMRASMKAEMALKEEEANRQRKRIKELEEMQEKLQDALRQEIKARQDEQAMRYEHTRLLEEEEEKLKQLMRLKKEQEEYIAQTNWEKQVLQKEMNSKSRALDEAQEQLERVRESRARADQDVEVAQRKLHQASTNVKHWNVQMNRLMHPIAPGEKRLASSSVHSAFCAPLLNRRSESLKIIQKAEEKDSSLHGLNCKEITKRDENQPPSHLSTADMMDPAP